MIAASSSGTLRWAVQPGWPDVGNVTGGRWLMNGCCRGALGLRKTVVLGW